MMNIFEITIQDVTGAMNIYIPFNLLKPVANVLNPHAWISGQKAPTSDPEARQVALESLSKVLLSVRILLGKADLTMGELTQLQPGDVIQLNTFVQENLPVQVGDTTRFLAQVGRVGNRMVAQITTIINPAVEITNDYL